MENKNKSFLPLALALVALALGGAALFVSINSVQKQKASELSLGEKSDKALAVAVESKTAIADSKNAMAEISRLKQEVESLKAALKQNTDTTNKNIKAGFEYYAKTVSENRNLILANQEGIKKLSDRTLVQDTPKQDAPAVIESAENPEYVIYVIKSGDYFSKLAKQFNVSIEAIEEANPNVSSTALQIGQKINIPKAK